MRRLATAIASEIGRDELLLVAGLLLVGAGFWDTWRPAAFLVPGVVLIWLALPGRGPLVVWPAESTTDKRTD